MIDAPDILQRTCLVIAREVATAVEPRAGHGGERVWQEALGGQRRAVEVTLGQTMFGADAQLAHTLGGKQFETTVQHIQGATVDGPANRHAKRIAGVRQLAGVYAGHHARFGRPVGVDQAHAAQAGGVPRTQPFHRHRLAADMHLTQVAQGALVDGTFLGQQIPVGRWQVRQGHALLDDVPRQLPGVPQFVATHDQRRAHTQRRVALLDKAIEAERGKLQHPVCRAQAAVDLGAVAELAEGGMVDGHALGQPGGARGVDHIGQVGSGGMVGWIGRRVACQFFAGRGETLARQPLGQRQVGQQPGFAEQQVEPAVRQHVGQAFGGVVRVQRHIGGATFEHRQQADDQLRATSCRQADALAWANAQFQQAMGKPVGASIELGVAQACVARLHGHRVGCGAGLGGNAFVHAQVTLGRAGRLAEGKHVAPCDLVEQKQVANGRLGIREHLHQQVVQVAA
ncbi:hypothetical protein ALQ17_05346 [Pseudomonas fluorescens]|nr:hypothetical protein ALQ17_05346 [Pseudomonas fluorescens]